MNFQRCAHQTRRCLLPLLGLFLGSGPLWAAQVTTSIDGNGAGSLRSVVAAGGAVTFAPGLAGQTIALTLGPINVPDGTTITGLGASSLSVDGNQISRIFDVDVGATATISGLRLSNGNAGAGGQGGAIRNLGSLILDGVAISANAAGDAGGGIYNTGTLDVRASTLDVNRVTDSGCAGGGAIRSEGSGSQLTITNSTLSANTATNCSGGGVSFNNGVATITASTLSANSAGASGGNLYKGSAAASLTLSASVISDGASGGGTPVNTDLHGAVGGGLVSSGYNLVRVRGDGIGYVASDLAAGTAPLLSALANYGGPTATLALQSASPLIDARPAPCPTSADQRGTTRPQGAACDIGAFEYRQNRLTATVAGLGSVSAGATPVPRTGSISNCLGTCTADYDGEVAPSVTLTATPAFGWILVGWNGDCTGSAASVSVTMDRARSCTATFVLGTAVVTASAGSNGTISPNGAQTVNIGSVALFTLAPATGYHIDTVTGCGGTRSGSTYTTAPVTAACTVNATFAVDTFTVTPSAGAHGAISPNTAQTANYGSTVAFLLTPDTGYHIDTVTGCGGTRSGSTYTTGAITAACAVNATFAIDTFTVTPSAGPHGAISPNTAQTADYGSAVAFVLTPDTGYHIDTVTGCGGTRSGSTYTTGAITAACAVNATFAIDTFTVTPSVSGSNGTISPQTAQTVNYGAATHFTLTPAANYHVASVGGTCVGSLAGTTYTTNAISADCTVIASFTIDTHTVTPSVDGSNGTISPAIAQTVNHGATTAFMLTPSANHHVASVTGTCGGNLVGTSYTTSAVSADCTVIASFAIDTHTVTPSVDGGNGTISPSTAQTVDHGAATSFSLTPAANHHVASVTGTCSGSLAGTTYTTNGITADCTVIASFAIDTHTVTPSVNGGNGTISPSTAQTINHGAPTSFALTSAANHHIASVGGTCGGTLTGTSYTTNGITADCTVIANFAIDTHTVTPSVDGGNGTISPSTAQTVNHGATTGFTLTPAANYHVASVGGTCGGTLTGTSYTTSVVNADCTVIANFAIDTHTVTPSVTGSNGTISPSMAQTVDHGATTAFTLAPAMNYHVASVAGTCGGTLTGVTYTTNAITVDCTVVASFAIDTFTITPQAGAHGAISPDTPQTIDYNATVAFTLAPDTGYHIDTASGCGGALAGNVYTTAVVTEACTVAVTFAIDTFTVTPSAGEHGAISPETPQTVDYNDTVTFTLTPDPGHRIDSVSGCSGTLAGSTYTTGPITAACTVEARFVVATYAVGGSVTGLLGGHLALQLNGAQDLPIDANGEFVFADPLNDLGSYAVTISQQPTAPAHRCTVSNGAGTLAGADVTDVVVTCERLLPQLAISVSDGGDYARYGMLLNYVVTVRNSGQGDAEDLSLSNIVPPQLDASLTRWICLDSGDGAVCTAEGSGALEDSQVLIPAGRSLTWLVSAPVRLDAEGDTVDYSVSVFGANPVSDSDSDTLVVLRSGFDVADSDGADAAGGDAVACAPQSAPTGLAADPDEIDFALTRLLTLPPAKIEGIERILHARDASGAGIGIERLSLGDDLRVRLTSRERDGRERASAWAVTSVGAPLALAVADTGRVDQLLLEGATPSLDLPLPAGLIGPLRVLPLAHPCRP